MGLVSLTNITNGTLADATTVMANYNAILTAVNGHLDGSNLDPTLLALLGASDPVNVRTGNCITPATEVRNQAVSGSGYGLMPTPDRVNSLVLPNGGVFEIAYEATWSESVSQQARAAIFIGANQLRVSSSGGNPLIQEAYTAGGTVGSDTPLSTFVQGLLSGTPGNYTGDVTTGQVLGTLAGNFLFGITPSSGAGGGKLLVFAAPGTYDVAVQFKVASGTVTVKNRRLYVKAIGY